MDEVRTNIVPVVKPEDSQTEKENLNKEEDYAQNLERDLISFLQEEFKGNTNIKFWTYVRDFADRKMGGRGSEETIIPMTDEQCKKFAKQIVPWGKHEGRVVGGLLKKDREFLERMATKPLLFQVQLQKYLAANKSPDSGKKS